MAGRSFSLILADLFGHEGGFTDDPRDPGNWTGGGCQRGRCAGTKFGISAAAYPLLDIENLSLAGAEAIYRRDYWDRIHGDDLPAGLAVLVFDAAVNNGVARAARWLQAVLGVTPDGEIGPRTLSALAARSADWKAIACEYHALRFSFMGGLPSWSLYGLGWSRRLVKVLAQALEAGR